MDPDHIPLPLRLQAVGPLTLGPLHRLLHKPHRRPAFHGPHAGEPAGGQCRRSRGETQPRRQAGRQPQCPAQGPFLLPCLDRQPEHRLPQMGDRLVLDTTGYPLHLVGIEDPGGLPPLLVGTVHRDFQQPGPGGIRVPQLPPLPPGPENGLAHRVLGVGVAIQQGPGRPEQAPAVLRHQGRKLLPGTDPACQFHGCHILTSLFLVRTLYRCAEK